MTLKIKILGLLLIVSAIAIGTTAASIAQAEVNGVFTAGSTPETHQAVVVQGKAIGTSEDNYLEFGESKVTCENQGLASTGTGATGTAKELTIAPVYKDCTADGLPMTVSMNGCEYVVNQPTRINGVGSGEYTSTVSMVCPEGTVALIEVFLFGTPTGSHTVKVCTVEIFPKVNLSHVTYSSDMSESTGKDSLKVLVEIKGTKYRQKGTCGAKEGEDSSYFGTGTATGWEDGGAGKPLDIWISDEK